MANLETLELTISSNAEQATQGISQLTLSLSSLSSAVGKSVSGLIKLNDQLSKLKSFGKMKLPNIGAASGARSVAAGAKKNTSYYNPLTNNNRIAVNRGDPNAVPDDVWQQKYNNNLANAYWKKTFGKSDEFAKYFRGETNTNGGGRYFSPEIQRYNELYKQLGEEGFAKKVGMSVEDANARLKYINETFGQVASSAKEAGNGIGTADKAIKETSEDAEQSPSALAKLKTSFSNFTKGFSTFFSKVKRIATTMLIRSAIRGLIRSMKEGINNLREWSKLNNGDFAKSLDTLKSKALQLKNSIGASIAPILQAAIPVINAVANAAISAFNWVNQLISLLTGKSSWTKATEGVEAYTDAAKGAGGATKDWLASFDELNVMNSDGGGGGSGVASEYEDMFEEVYSFDSKIRELANFLKDNAESIKDIAIATGVAILGWKLGNAFAETLPLLSKIAGLIGVGAVIAITLQADWMLTNQYLNTGEEGWLISSLLTNAIGGTAAYAIAKKLIGGKAGYYAFGFTLLFSALTDIKANIEHTDVEAFSKESLLTNIKAALVGGAGIGLIAYAAGATIAGTLVAAGGGALFLFAAAIGLKLLTQKNQIKWGDLALTEEQIDEYVKTRMFTAEARVLVDKIDLILTNKSQIETGIRGKIESINSELNVLNLGIDKAATLENIATIIGNEQNGLVKDIADLCNINISLLKLTFSSMTAYDGEGNAISTDTLLTGIQGWEKVNETMTAKGKELTSLLIQGAKGELSPEMEKYTQELLEEVMGMTQKITNAQEFAKTSVAFKTAALEAMNKDSVTGILDAFKTYSSANEETIRNGWIEVAESYIALAELENDPTLKAEYQKKAEDIIAGLDKTVAEELKKQNQPGIDIVTEWLKNNVSLSNLSGVDYWIGYLKGNGFTKENFSFALKSLMLNNGVDKTVIEAMDLVGFSGWDLLSKELKKKFLGSVKIDRATIKELQVIGVKVEELVEVIEWDKFSEEQRFEFLDAIKSAYGSREALQAAKNAGINIAELVDQGMNSENEIIRRQAEYWSRIIKEGVESEPPVVSPELDKPKTKTIADEAKKTFEDTKPTITVNKVVVPQEQKNNVVNELGGLKPTVKPNTSVPETQLNNLKSQIEGVKPTVTANVKAGSFSEFRSAFIKALSAKLNLKSMGVDYFIGQLTARANGGFVDGGDIFIANENGVPEMIGRFGNQTAVANTDQIVSGIASGVAQANEEQNALLRQQNTLLRGILEKEASVKFGASVALGRVAKQSLDMYSGLVGVR